MDRVISILASAIVDVVPRNTTHKCSKHNPKIGPLTDLLDSSYFSSTKRNSCKKPYLVIKTEEEEEKKQLRTYPPLYTIQTKMFFNDRIIIKNNENSHSKSRVNQHFIVANQATQLSSGSFIPCYTEIPEFCRESH